MAGAKPAQILQSREFVLFAEFFQFYLHDENSEADLRDGWDDLAREQMIAVGDRIIAIGTVRNLDVPVTVEVLDQEPEDEDLSDWDHEVECFLDIPSGKLVVSGPTEDLYDAARIELSPGTYAVRAYYAALDQVDNEGFEGDDFYKVSLWRDDPRGTKVLKQWAGLAEPEQE